MSTTATSVSISIPTPLRAYTGGLRAVDAEGATVGQVLADAAARHPELSRHIFSEGGGLRGFVNLYLGDDNVRDLEGVDTPVRPGATLTILPSIAGG
jgi:molybdopterin converting factor small subunit